MFLKTQCDSHELSCSLLEICVLNLYRVPVILYCLHSQKIASSLQEKTHIRGKVPIIQEQCLS